jgi:hypothetical protein
MNSPVHELLETHAPMLCVESLELAYTDDERELFVLQARGRVPCGAWTDARLSPIDADDTAVKSGAMEFRLVAKRPPAGTFVIETFAHSLTAVYVGNLPE